MEYKRNEIGAGIFLLVSFAILVVMIFAVSDIQSLFKKKKEFKVLFQFSDGIEKNAQVRYSGIKIGKVIDVRVAPEQGDRIELTLSVLRDSVIKTDTKASIKTLGLVGGKYVELTGGSPGAKPIEPGSILVGEESFKIEDLTKIGLEIAGKVKNIINNLDHIAGDPATATSVKAMIKNLQDLSANLKVMTSNNEQIAQGLPLLLKRLDDTTNNLKTITEKTDKIVGDNQKKVDDTMDNVRQITQNVKDFTAEVKAHPWKLLRKP